MAVRSAFDVAASEIGELFADYLDGDANRPFFTLSRNVLDATARGAIEKSLAAFGYPPDSCTFATIYPSDAEAEGGDIKLDAQAAFLMLEGLDPVKVICADGESAKLLASAYRCEIAIDSPTRIFGRAAVAFSDLSSLLETDGGKQRAWSLLKSLK